MCERHFRAEDYFSCSRRLKRGLTPSQHFSATEHDIPSLSEQVQLEQADSVENNQEEPTSKMIRFGVSEATSKIDFCSIQQDILRAEEVL